MHELKNWMWYKSHCGGPVAAFGTHQIDVFNWFLGATPKCVTARGGTYFFDPKNHEQCDTVMAILEYETPGGVVSAQYQTVNSNGYGGHYEAFMGDQGTLKMSEMPAFMGVYHDPEGADWERWLRLGLLSRPEAEKGEEEETGVLDVQQTKPPELYQVPVEIKDSYFKAHLDNFVDAVRGKGELTCPAEVGFAATVTTLKINEAIAAGKSITLTDKDFEV
jgi:predicted dehydrogenase